MCGTLLGLGGPRIRQLSFPLDPQGTVRWYHTNYDHPYLVWGGVDNPTSTSQGSGGPHRTRFDRDCLLRLIDPPPRLEILSPETTTESTLYSGRGRVSLQNSDGRYSDSGDGGLGLTPTYTLKGKGRWFPFEVLSHRTPNITSGR